MGKKKDKKVEKKLAVDINSMLQDYVNNEVPYYLNFGEFNEENYLQLVKEVNDTRNIFNKQLILNSFGGETQLINPMTYLLESNNISLVASGHIISSAFILFFQTQVNKIILPNTMGMFHYPYYNGVTVSPDKKMKISGEFEEFFYSSKKNPAYDVEFFKELLEIDSKKHKMLKKGGELLFTTQELADLAFKAAEILQKKSENNLED